VLMENDVIEAVCRHLEHDGHRIISRSATRQRGIDIVAEHSEAGRVVLKPNMKPAPAPRQRPVSWLWFQMRFVIRLMRRLRAEQEGFAAVRTALRFRLRPAPHPAGKA
jgi:hypothetical protein